MTPQIIVALDFPSENSALSFVDIVGSDCDFYKVGMELFTAVGPPIIVALRARAKRIFLDLKYHDIPNTVRGAARSAARHGCDLITVHVSGGTAMLAAAVQGAREGSQDISRPCKVFGVSVLTSLDDESLRAAWGRDATLRSSQEVVRLAHMAVDAGLQGLVCSAQEAAAVRAAVGDGLELLVPGIRFESDGSSGDQRHDQVRVATPRAAAAAGANYLILGRAVTQDSDPAALLREVRRSLVEA
jgi:orotidine-5'-phosphate decarboxylase